MTWEWKIGDPVDDSNGGTMDAMNWGHGNDDENNYNQPKSNNSNSSSGRYRPYIDTEKRNKIMLQHKKIYYENKLKEARQQTNDEYRIKYYGEALKYAMDYFKESEKLGITIDGMPGRKHLLSKEDVDWISEKHYNEAYKLHILSTDQTENLEKLLKQSGNGYRIRENEETLRERREEYTRRMGIDHTKYLIKDYFNCIEKANKLVLKNKFPKAIKQYQKAINDYENFFQSIYATNHMKRQMPDKSLTPEAVDNIMKIYRKTHPLLTSKKSDAKINSQVCDMMSEEWADSLSRADMEVNLILEQKKLERQKRIEKIEDIAVDVIVGARTVGNSILDRLIK